MSPPQRGRLALKTWPQTGIQEAAGETRPDPAAPSGASCGDSQVRGWRLLPTWGNGLLWSPALFHLPTPLARCRDRFLPQTQGAPRGPELVGVDGGGAHQACRVDVPGQCRQRRPSAGVVRLVLFSVSCSLPPAPSQS